ncbi:MAG: RNA 3'-terminal phosphate cyclase, partial [Candidatus Methylomirabilales bacterium]
METIIDGAYGEGGGQILRTALSLSALLTRPVRIENIRAGRRNPGLQAQHLVALQALGEITRAEVEGARVGATAIRFAPGPVHAGSFRFAVGTAGAVTLVLQAVLLPLAWGDSVSALTITGGTHVPWSPPVPYLEEVLLPALAPAGLHASVELLRWGFYPKGGGEVRVMVRPASGTLRPLTRLTRGMLRAVRGTAAAVRLPRTIAERLQARAEMRLRDLRVPVAIEVVEGDGPGPGAHLFLLAEAEGSRAGFAALGERGKPAERVADEACAALGDYLETDGALDPHLADQILPALVLAEGESVFTTTALSPHLLTNAWA